MKPLTQADGNATDGLRLILLTSEHGHYSIEKAAQMLGFGSSAVRSIPVCDDGRMDVDALDRMVAQLKSDDLHPFYVNATAGTTVLGSYDPIASISAVCKNYGLWLHVDASWGGPAVFSEQHQYKLEGSHLADSIAINPHKMMVVPLTCSFLLGRDLRQFQTANTLRADYLFHGPAASSADEMYDLADLTLQCGRRGDALKLYMSWVYHGTQGYSEQINHAFNMATYMSELVRDHQNFILVSTCPPPCLQVCFFYAPKGKLQKETSKVTKQIVRRIKEFGFVIDYAAIDDRGAFLRPVIHRHVKKETVDTLLMSIEKIGAEIDVCDI